MAGAVGGFFLAQGTIANRKNESTAALSQAEDTLKTLRQYGYINSITPELFSQMEALTGAEDKEFGYESARQNVRKYEQAKKSQLPVT